MKKYFAILNSTKLGISLMKAGLLVLILPYISLPQIKIDERVEILPESYNYETDDPILNHIIQLDVQWNQPQYNAAIAGVVVPCQSTGADWQSGGIISLIIENAMAGFYRLQPRFNTPSGVTTHVTYQLYLNGTEVLNGQRDVPGGFSGGSFPAFNIDYTPPLASSFYFNLQNNTSCILIPTPIEISASASCATGYSWYVNTEPLNLTFTSGGEFASFYTNGQKIGDSYSGTLSEIQHINVIQDKVYRENADMYYVVQGDWAGVIKKDSVRLISQIGDVITLDTGGDDSLYTGQQIQVELYPNDFGGQCSGIFFPYEVTYNVEIINGNQFGNLIDPFTNQRVQIVTCLSHWYGMSAFNYIADGISADSLERVIIRISTSDPDIPSTDLTLYIKPSPIYAYIVPEVLGADEEADVIIKKRNPDGTLEDFPANQTFELAVLDGCVNGNFMVNGVIDVYFADAQQPIKFVTADSIDTEFDKVLIRVSTDLGGYNRPVGGESGEEEQKRAEYESRIVGAAGKTIKELREGFEKMIAERKAEAEAKEGGEPMFPIVTYCAPNSSSYATYYDFGVSVQDECDEYICKEVILKPSFSFEHYPNKTFNEDPCTVEQSKHSDRSVSGVFSPLWNRTIITAIEYFKMENLTACYQPINGKWAFGTRLPSYPYYQAIMDVCLTNITNRGYRYLYDISEIQSKWNDPDICKAKKDLEGHKKYPSEIRTGGYIFIDVKMAHEMAHGQDFQWVIDSLQTAFLYTALDLLEVTCGKYDEENRKANSDDYAKSIYFKYLQKVIAGEKSGEQVTFLGFEDRLYESYNNHINQSYTVNGKQVDHENYINSLPIVTNTINVLISEFKNIWNCN